MDWEEKSHHFMREYGKLCVAFGLVLMSCGAVAFIVSQSLPHKLRVSFLDIGQGDSILIQTPSGHSMIVDGGVSNALLARLAEHMNYFDRQVDVMIATHGDADHITGLISTLETYDIKRIILSGNKSETGVFKDFENHIAYEHADVRIGNVGDVIDFQDGVTATILHPYANEHFKDANEASVSIVVKYGDENFLLTGDLPSDKESLLLSSKLLPRNISVYKAGHHGSKYSSGEALLSYIKPDYAIISAGKDNKYGHPNVETITRLQKYAKQILSTIDRGTISFLTDGKRMEVKTQK